MTTDEATITQTLEPRSDKESLARRAAERRGWLGIELEHALSMLDNDAYGHESMIMLASGRQIRCPATPGGCDYVRICDQGFELAYWVSDEWQRDPSVVMGAIMGCALSTQDSFSDGDRKPEKLYRTTLVIWTEQPVDGIENEDLVRDANLGDAYCSGRDTTIITDRALMPDTDFFDAF